MSDKSLRDKAINIKGKQYVLVADRVTYFNETYPEGSITTEYELLDKMFVVKATIKPNANQTFTGLSQAIIGDGFINKTASLENAETSAVGRALAMMGIGVIESIASVDEINKATGSTGEPKPDYTPYNKTVNVSQAAELLKLSKEASGLDTREKVEQWFYEVVGMQVNQVKQIEFEKVKELIMDSFTVSRDAVYRED